MSPRRHRRATFGRYGRDAMDPELGLVLAAVGVAAFTVGVGALVLRTPRCPGCGRPGQPEAREIAGAGPAFVVVVYRCPPCDQPLGRRTLVHPD
jgi:hypothetical protein